MLKDRKWAEREIKRYLRLFDRVPTGALTEAGNPATRRRGTNEQITDQGYVIEQIAREVFEIDGFWRLTPDAARRLLVEIRRGAEIEKALGAASPALAADQLHPWVWSAAASHWDSDAHRAAVWAAGINVNSRLQKKLGRSDLGEAKLVQEAFSTTPPSPGRPRLRLCDDSNPDLFRDMHVGAMNLGTGLYAAVRNVVSHIAPDEHDLGEQEALECLSAWSLLARWIDRAAVASAE